MSTFLILFSIIIFYYFHHLFFYLIYFWFNQWKKHLLKIIFHWKMYSFLWTTFKCWIVSTDDVVYNQSCNAASTLDKRRPDLRDELGYIAPPNRKLPPVPGSNYNTCDRIKRGTALSKIIHRFLACIFTF